MSESIVELRIKGYTIRVDKESISIFDKSDLLFKANFQQVKVIFQWIITKANELKNAAEIKKIETKE